VFSLSCCVGADQLCICFVCVSLHMLTLLCTLVRPHCFVVEPLNEEVSVLLSVLLLQSSLVSAGIEMPMVNDC
jgi:hypothetical protein